MTAQRKPEQPEYEGRSRKDQPEMPGGARPKPEMTGKGKPGSMPENPANIDHEHEPAGLEPGTDRTKERPNK